MYHYVMKILLPCSIKSTFQRMLEPSYCWSGKLSKSKILGLGQDMQVGFCG